MTLPTRLAVLMALALMLPAPPVLAQQTEAQIVLASLTDPGKETRKERKARLKAEALAEAERSELKAMVHVVAAQPKQGRIWCVPFARAVTGIEIKGNAATWWKQAPGRYDRGQEPQVGAVMNFSASKAMPMGHVAVVSQVVGARAVLVDQANWERNRITQDTLVVDVSANNDWSQVRVANANGTLGRVNPVYGFIYR